MIRRLPFKIWSVVCVLTCAIGMGAAYSQSSGLGNYVGTVKLSGTKVDPRVTFQATVQLNLPVSERDYDYTLEPSAESGGEYGPIIQEWDPRLVR